MKRGFLSAKQRPGASSFGPPLPQAKRNGSTTSTASEAVSVPVKVKNDYTVVYEENPLILISDHRLDEPCYFGYFPPGETPSQMVIIDSVVEKIEAAADWPAWKNEKGAANNGAREWPFQVKAVEGRGMAMIAARDVPAGELICKERPTFVSIQTKNVAPDQAHETGDFYRAALSRLGLSQQKAIMDLSSCYGDQKDIVPGILSTNYLPVDMQDHVDLEGPNYCGCFPTLSRANHSCAPNANYFFHFPDFTGRFYAVRNIKAGEEIEIMYCDLLQSQQARRESLFKSHRFFCHCDFCTTPPTSIQTKNSNSNRAFVKDIIYKLGALNGGPVSLEDIQRAIVLTEQEGMTGNKAVLLYTGGSYFLGQGAKHAAQAVRWLQEAMKLYEQLEGRDSSHVRELRDALRA